MAPGKEFKFRPHLDKRQRKAGASMNPIAIYAEQQRLSLTQLAAWLGVSRPYLSDVVNCRRPKPKTLLANFAAKTGIDPRKLDEDYARCRAALEDIEERGALIEIEESDQTFPAIAPRNPLAHLLEKNGMVVEELANKTKGLKASTLRAILKAEADEADAHEAFALINALNPLLLIRANLYGQEMPNYRLCVDYKHRQAKVRQRYARVCSWIDLSQPRGSRD